MRERMRMVRACLAVLIGTLVIAWGPAADAQSTRCEIPRAARDIWRCERGFVIGPENVIIRLPIPETDPEALYNAGIEAAGREDWRVAIAYFTAAHQRDHRVPRYMYNLGLAHARAGNEVPAIAWLSTYLIAEPNAPNRSAIWAQISQLESAASARAELLWRRAQDGARVGGSAINDWGFRAVAYRNLSEAFASAGHLPRAREMGRLALAEESQGAPLSAESIAYLDSNLAEQAMWIAAREDFDLPSAENFAREAPADRLGNLEPIRNGSLRRDPINVRWPLSPSSDVLGYLNDHPGLFSASPEWRRDDYSRTMLEYYMQAAIERASSVAVGGGSALTPIRWHAYPLLNRTAEATAAIQRLAVGDWSGEPYDVALRSDDDSMRMMSDYDVAIDRAEDNLSRFVMAETAAGRLGEVCLRLADVACATSAARSARMISDRALRDAPRIDADIDGVDVFSAVGTWRAANFIGYSTARLEALLLAENGNVNGAVDHLAVFLSRKPHALVRYSAQYPEGPYIDESGGMRDTPRLSWSEARFLASYVLSDYLARRERFEEALQLAERLDSLRRQELYRRLRFAFGSAFPERVPEAPLGLPPGSIEKTPLEQAIVVARSLGGAAENLPAWIAAIETAPNPNQQIRLLAWAAEDLTRGVRRARAVYALAGGTWGQ